jgi:hypothetical protein
VGAFELVQPQRAGQRVEHLRRHVAGPALLEPGVVVDADPGRDGDLLPAQPGGPPPIQPDRQPEVARLQPGATRAQEVAELRGPIHPASIAESGRAEKGLGWYRQY